MDNLPRSQARRPQVWAVGGGKGGTGKSLVAASLGIHLAQMGRRVILVDGDLGAPNLHTVLGLDPPAVALSDFVKRRFESSRRPACRACPSSAARATASISRA